MDSFGFDEIDYNRKGVRFKMSGRSKTLFFVGLFMVSLGLVLGPFAQARDPKLDEMAQIQEIAYYLKIDTQAAYNTLANRAGTDPIIDRSLPQLQKLSEKAFAFYQRAVDSSKSPWRTTRMYEDLNQAFVDAKEAFISRSAYLVNPQAFEEIAYWMGGLLQYYLYPPVNSYEEGIVYSYPGPGYGQAVYSWVPSYYNFSGCRAFPWRASPWGRHVFR